MGGVNQLIPSDAILSLYRRYLKAALSVHNLTIRVLLIQQIRAGFRRHRYLRTPVAQKELIDQAQKDLHILEDPRHQRTLYINRFGMVTCMEWDQRRTEWHARPGTYQIYGTYLFFGYLFLFLLTFNARPVEASVPEIVKIVEEMAARLEVGDISKVPARRKEQLDKAVASKENQRDIESRILTSFKNVPEGAAVLWADNDKRVREMSLAEGQKLAAELA